MVSRKRGRRGLRGSRGKTAAILAAVAGLAGVTFGLASCSLGLDEALIDQTVEASASDAAVVDSFVAEGGDGAPLSPEGVLCTKDEDCAGTSGCFAARCDVPRKACVFQVCRQPACNSGLCDVASAKCGAPRPYKYRATQFPVGAQVGCGGVLSRCFAAVYPFVFVGTVNGVVAFPANDPLNATPTPVPVTGLGFIPSQIVASGSRIYFLGTPVGIGVSSRVPIAYADVPPDPFAAKVGVTTVLATFNRPATDPLVLLARGNDTALLLDTNVATAYASAPIVPPLVEPTVLNSTGTAFTAGAFPLAASGSRLLLGQINPMGSPIFGFVNAAGSATAQTVADVPLAAAAPAANPQAFAQSADGAIFWSYLSLTSAPPGPPAPANRAVKGYFLVADPAAAIDPTTGVDLELYAATPLGTSSVGPVAMLDAKTAMVTTANPANPGAVTNVSFVTRQPLALVKNADMQPRRHQITLNVAQLAVAGSNGLGYVLAVDPAAPAAPQVHVFDPACAP
jgi:hypothetical protein